MAEVPVGYRIEILFFVFFGIFWFFLVFLGSNLNIANPKKKT